jgi:hypothetical protein
MKSTVTLFITNRLMNLKALRTKTRLIATRPSLPHLDGIKFPRGLFFSCRFFLAATGSEKEKMAGIVQASEYVMTRCMTAIE